MCNEEKQAECLENLAWFLEQAAAHPVFNPHLLVMAACWEGLARGFSELASCYGARPGTDSSIRKSAGSTCIARAVEAERDASRTDNASLKQSLLRVARAWRRLASIYKRKGGRLPDVLDRLSIARRRLRRAKGRKLK